MILLVRYNFERIRFSNVICDEYTARQSQRRSLLLVSATGRAGEQHTVKLGISIGGVNGFEGKSQN